MAGRQLYFWDLDNALKRGKVASVYAFLGEEHFLKRRAVAALRDQAGADPDNPFSSETAYSEETSVPRFLDEARSLPFLGGRRFMLLKNAEKCKDADIAALEAYRKEPASFSVVVLEFSELFDPTARDNRNKKIFKFVEQSLPEHYLFQRLKGDSLTRFLDAYCAERGYQVDRGVTNLLGARLDGELSAIANELEKLHLQADGGLIRLAAAEQAAERHHKTNVFALLDALAARDANGALERMAYMREVGEEYLPVLFLIGRLYQEAIAYVGLVAEGLAESEIMSRLKLAPFRLRPLKTAAFNYSAADLRARLEMVGQWEEQFKSVRIDPDVHMDAFLVRLCARGKGRRP